MTNNELKRYFELCLIGEIVFYRIDRDDDDYPTRWEIWIYGGENTVNGIIEEPLKNSSRSKENKLYTSLDRAYSAMKKLGYHGKISIDG